MKRRFPDSNAEQPEAKRPKMNRNDTEDLRSFQTSPAQKSMAQLAHEVDEQKMSAGVKKEFLSAWGQRLESFREKYASTVGERSREGIEDTTRAERRLAKTAWVLEKLNSKRVRRPPGGREHISHLC